MKKRIRIILLLLAAAGGGWYWWRSQNNKDPNRILVSGNLEMTLVDISFKTSGRMTELTVREGDWVKKGAVIARLDQVQLKRQRARDQAQVFGAESNYRQLQTSIEYQKATLESDIAAKRAEVNNMQAKLDAMLSGSRKQDIQQAEAASIDAKAMLEFAKQDWARAQTLYKNQDISTQQYDQYRWKFDSANAAVRQAEEKLSLVKEGPRQEDIAAARAEVAKAQASLRMAEANRIEIQRKEQELVARQAEIERSRAQVGISESQLDDTVVYAPIDGVVLVKSAEVGEVLPAGTTIVTIADLDHPWLRAYINETDLGRIKLGNQVNLTTDSYPGKVYQGKISFISSQAEFTPKQIQTKEERVKLVYRIKVDVDNQSHDLKNNMPVDAEIRL
jgi:HlyD family secretion protein